MEISQSYLLTLTLALGYEYGLKHWWEALGSKFAKPLFGYLLYRLVHLVLLALTGYFLSVRLFFIDWIVVSSVFAILGSLELPVRVIINRIEKATGARLYQLNYLVPLSIVLFSKPVANFVPRFAVDYRLIFLFVFLAHPANYFIRWALNRDEPDFKAQTATDNLIDMSEAAATSADTPLDRELSEQRSKVGRRIGTIERWLIVLLIASQNVASLALVITAKSIVRYPQLGDREFAEYYLFGTLLSFVLALVSGLVVLGGL